MTAQAAFSLDAIDAALAAAGPSLDPDEQHLAAAVLRLLSAGEPVSLPAAAAAAGMATLFGTVRVTRCARGRLTCARPMPRCHCRPAGRPTPWPGWLRSKRRGSFETAHAAITRRCGPVMGKRQVE